MRYGCIRLNFGGLKKDLLGTPTGHHTAARTPFSSRVASTQGRAILLAAPPFDGPRCDGGASKWILQKSKLPLGSPKCIRCAQNSTPEAQSAIVVHRVLSVGQLDYYLERLVS